MDIINIVIGMHAFFVICLLFWVKTEEECEE